MKMDSDFIYFIDIYIILCTSLYFHLGQRNMTGVYNLWSCACMDDGDDNVTPLRFVTARHLPDIASHYSATVKKEIMEWFKMKEFKIK